MGLLKIYSEMKSLYGENLSDEILTKPTLPYGAITQADQLLSATLGCMDITGDLAPYGWRLGVGNGLEFRLNQDFWQTRLAATQIAFMDYQSPLNLAFMGPISLAVNTYKANGERSLADQGLLREISLLLAEGANQLGEKLQLNQSISAELIIEERKISKAMSGQIPSVSGYRFLEPLGESISDIWGSFLANTTLESTWIIDSEIKILNLALAAGVRKILFDPAVKDFQTNMQAWEMLAAAYEKGVEVGFLVPPQSNMRMAIEELKQHVWQKWNLLGFSDSQFSGFSLMLNQSHQRPYLPRENLTESPSHQAFLKNAGFFLSS